MSFNISALHLVHVITLFKNYYTENRYKFVACLELQIFIEGGYHLPLGDYVTFAFYQIKTT